MHEFPPLAWPETLCHTSASILSMYTLPVTLGNCHFLSSLFPLLSQFFFSSPFPSSYFFGLPMAPRGPYGPCSAPVEDLWAKKVVHVENNFAWGFYKRKSKDEKKNWD